MLEEQPDVIFNLARLDLVEDKYVCRFGQQRKLETIQNVGLWAASDEELDIGDLGHKLPKDRKDCRSRFVVLAFVQGVDHDDGRNGGFREGLNDQLLHLVVEGLVDDLRICLDQRDEHRSKLGVPPGKLDSQGGED